MYSVQKLRVSLLPEPCKIILVVYDIATLTSLLSLNDEILWLLYVNMTSVMHAPPLEESGSVVGGCMVGRDPVLVPRRWVSRGQVSRLLPLNTRFKTVLERSLTRKYQNYRLKNLHYESAISKRSFGEEHCCEIG